MKIKLSKSQWEKVGRTAGWLTEDEIARMMKQVDDPDKEKYKMDISKYFEEEGFLGSLHTPYLERFIFDNKKLHVNEIFNLVKENDSFKGQIIDRNVNDSDLLDFISYVKFGKGYKL